MFGKTTTDPRLQEGAYVSKSGKLYRNCGLLAHFAAGANTGQDLWKLEDAMSYGHNSVTGDPLHEVLTITTTELLCKRQDGTDVYRLEREAKTEQMEQTERMATIAAQTARAA